VSGGLLLAACGGGGGSDSSDPIHPATTAPASAPPATTPAQTQAAGPKAPTFDIPSDITIDFKGFDAVAASNRDVVRDARYAITALLEAEATVHAKETPNFKRYWTGVPGATYADTIIARGRQGKIVTGTYRYYAPSVAKNPEGMPVVSYCEDQRKAYAKNAHTGKVTVTTPSLSDFRAWSLIMTKDSAGDWQVANYNWQQGAKKCQVL
jgi:hypothetical protein